MLRIDRFVDSHAACGRAGVLQRSVEDSMSCGERTSASARALSPARRESSGQGVQADGSPTSRAGPRGWYRRVHHRRAHKSLLRWPRCCQPHHRASADLCLTASAHPHAPPAAGGGCGGYWFWSASPVSGWRACGSSRSIKSRAVSRTARRSSPSPGSWPRPHRSCSPECSCVRAAVLCGPTRSPVASGVSERPAISYGTIWVGKTGCCAWARLRHWPCASTPRSTFRSCPGLRL